VRIVAEGDKRKVERSWWQRVQVICPKCGARFDQLTLADVGGESNVHKPALHVICPTCADTVRITPGGLNCLRTS
jgi:Zn finger protein HypA/HybF involved in hydrogenase expression